MGRGSDLEGPPAGAGANGSLEAPGGPKASPPPLHDFQKPRLLSEREAAALEAAHRKLARSLSESLSALLRTPARCDLAHVAQRPYFEFIRSLSSPTCLHLVYCLPQRAPFVLELSPSILFPMLERLLGGKGDSLSVPARPLTRIEQGLARSVVNVFLAALRECWGGGDLRLDIAETEHNPLLMQVVGPAEPSIVLPLDIALGARSGRFQICLPLRSFEPLVARLAFPGSGPDPSGSTPAERARILRRLGDGEVRLAAELPPVPIALADLLALRPGDVIDTRMHRDADVVLCIEGRPRFRARAAARQGRRAVKITGLTESAGSAPAAEPRPA
jgi:flagellar motor switch protein FliM